MEKNTTPAFSPQDANRMLPQIRGKVAHIVHIYKKMKEISDRAPDSFEAARAGGNARVHPVYFRFLEDLHSRLGEVTAVGCEVKDLETGLIDFPSRRQGKVVYLCWRLGEKRVGHWHEVNAGYAGRKPVDWEPV